jgi:hypothetical protein
MALAIDRKGLVERGWRHGGAAGNLVRSRVRHDPLPAEPRLRRLRPVADIRKGFALRRA